MTRDPYPTALILDADERSALAATRSLGGAGIQVVTAGTRTRTLAGSSRHSAAALVYPPPDREPEGFVAAVADGVRRCGADVLLPMTDLTLGILLQAAERLPPVGFPYPSPEAYEAVTDKFELFARAAAARVPIPRTLFIDTPETLAAMLHEVRYPAVLKPARSRYRVDGGWRSSSVRIARDEAELRRMVGADAAFAGRFLIQAFVQGYGHGHFVLYDHGRTVARFAHRRLREKPPAGGVSVLCESVPLNLCAAEIADALLGPLDWHGVAMVEFRVANDGTPYLMEINARPWGSMQLAVDAGADFPLWLWRIARGEPVTAAGYRVGIRSRWLLGDLDHLYLQLRGRGTRRGLAGRLAAIGTFLSPPGRPTRHEINRWGDPAPSILEARRWLGLSR